MTDHGVPLPDLACREFVELVTDYMDDALPAEGRAQVDQHLEICEGCQTVLAQWQEVIRLTGRLGEAEVEALDPATRDQLMAAFRRRRDG